MKKLLLFASLTFLICYNSKGTTIVDLYYKIPSTDVAFGCEIMNITDNKETREKCLDKESITETYLEFTPSCGDGSTEYLLLIHVDGSDYLLLKQYYSNFSDINFGLIVYKVEENSLRRIEKSLFTNSYNEVISKIYERNEFPEYKYEDPEVDPGFTLELSKHGSEIKVIIHPEINSNVMFGSFILEEGKYKFYVNN